MKKIWQWLLVGYALFTILVVMNSVFEITSDYQEGYAIQQSERIYSLHGKDSWEPVIAFSSVSEHSRGNYLFLSSEPQQFELTRNFWLTIETKERLNNGPLLHFEILWPTGEFGFPKPKLEGVRV